MVLLTTALTFLHVLFGVAWIGAALLVTFVIFPTGRRMSPAGRVEFITSLVPIIGPYMMVVSVLTLLFGVLLAYDMSGGALSVFTTIGWGTWISAGAGMGLAAFVVGELLILPEAKRFREALRQAPGGNPDDMSGQLDAFMKKLDRLGYVGLALLLLTLLTMAFAATT